MTVFMIDSEESGGLTPALRWKAERGLEGSRITNCHFYHLPGPAPFVNFKGMDGAFFLDMDGLAVGPHSRMVCVPSFLVRPLAAYRWFARKFQQVLGVEV